MANKDKRTEKRRAARLRSKASHAAPEIEVDEIEELEEELDELDDSDTEELGDEQIPVMKELAQKDMGQPMEAMNPMSAPTSWAEQDAYEMAQEQAEQVKEVSYTAMQLVNNILCSPMSTDEKSKAIQAVGDGFSAKLKEEQSPDTTQKEIDLDLLEIEAMIAKDKRHTPIGEKVGDWIAKAKLTTSAENNLSDSQFAFVTTRNGKKVRKYPIHDKAHVRNALARTAQMIKRGGPDAADAKAALSKIHAAAKKMGIGQMNKEKNSLIIEKDLSGNWRAILWPTNNFIDTDNEIISEKAHLEYVEWANMNMDCAPVFVTWHIPGTARTHSMDFVGYESGSLVTSCALTEKEAAELLKAQTLTDIGLSHGSIVLERDPQDARIITKYRMVEVSDLPLENAANPFTSLQTVITKEAGMDVKKYLVGMLGEEKAEEYLSKMSDKQKILKEADVETKEVQVEVQKPDSPEAPVLNMDEVVSKVFERVTKELDVEGLNAYLSQLQDAAAKVPVLEGLVKELAESREEKLADMIAPPITKTFVWQNTRASQSPDTVLKDGDKKDAELKKSKPELGWLSEATGTVPVQA